MMPIDLDNFVGHLTQEQTAELLALLWQNITEEQKMDFIEAQRGQIQDLLEQL